jgi:uncharacterized membrane protein YagU involved in acid resistance
MDVKPILGGLAAGAAATVPMSVAMEGMHRALPRRERYPLPPRLVTERILTEKLHLPLGLRREKKMRAATWASHFAYGAAMGGVYALVEPRLASRLPPGISGAAFGAAVWASSYFGLLPALDILSPAHRHPPRRNLVMGLSHLVWGAALGAGVARRHQRDPGERGGGDSPS